jgi:hypothetical protein
MKYLLIFIAFSATTLYADTYEGKNGKAAHNRHGTAVQKGRLLSAEVGLGKSDGRANPALPVSLSELR